MAMGRLYLPPESSITSKGPTNLKGSSVLIEAASVESFKYGRVGLRLGVGDQYAFDLTVRESPANQAPTLYAARWVGWVESRFALRRFDPTGHRWWRIRENGGTLIYELSPDKNRWTTLGHVNHGLSDELLASMVLTVFHDNDRGLGPAIFDNLNVPAPLPEQFEETGTVPRRSTMEWMRAGPTAVQSWSGVDVPVGICDQGTTAAMRAFNNLTLHAREDLTAQPAASQGLEVWPEAQHGCQTAACGVPHSGRVVDIIIGDRSGRATDTIMARGVIRAIELGAQVVNLSYGGYFADSGIFGDAAQFALDRGVPVFIAAGNDNLNRLANPALYSTGFENVHSVGASNERADVKANFSNYATTMTGLAPGDQVAGLFSTGAVHTWSGTSAAAPHAAQLCARLMTGGLFTGMQAAFALKATRRDMGLDPAQQGGGAYAFAPATAYLQPGSLDGGTVAVALDAGRAVLRRASSRRSGTVAVQLDTIPRATNLSKSAQGVATVGLDTPRAVSARQIVGHDVITSATALPRGKGKVGGTSVVSLESTPTLRTPRKHVRADVVATVNPTAAAFETLRWAPIPREAQQFPFEFLPTDIRFIAQDILTRRWLHWDLPIVDAQMTWNLSGPFELTGVLTPALPDVRGIGMDQWSTFIHVEYQGIILGTGILQPMATTDDALVIEAVGVSSYPNGIPYLQTFAEFFPDIMTVMRELWRHIQSYPNGNIGVLMPSGFMGVPLYGKPGYDRETGKLLGYEKWSIAWPDFTDCGSLIDELAESTPFDYNEVHAWNRNRTDILHGINFGYPRLGGKRTDLRFVENENILEALPVDEPDDAYASDIIIKGAGEGFNQIFAYVGVSIWNRLRRVQVITDEQVTTVSIGNGIASQEIMRRMYARGVSSIVVEAFHPHASLGTYEVGDDILIEGYQTWYGHFALWHRITAIQFTPDTGTAVLETARSESFRYGRPYQ